MKRWLRIFFQIISILIFILILWRSGTDAWSKITTGIPKFILLALLLRGLSGMTATTRLQLNTKGIIGKKIAWRRLYYVTMTTRALGLVIPRSLSTIGGKSIALRSHGISTRRSIWIVLVDNMFDLALLGLMLIPAILGLYGVLDNWQGVGLAVLLWLFLGAIIWWVTRGDHLTAVFLRLEKYPGLVKRFGGQLNPEERLMPPPKQALVAYNISIFLNFILALSFFFIARAIDVEAGLAILLLGFPIVQLSLIAAVTPGGLGIFDLGWLGILTLANIPEADALAFVVAQRAYLTLFVLFWTGISIILNFTENLPSRLWKKNVLHIDES